MYQTTLTNVYSSLGPRSASSSSGSLSAYGKVTLGQWSPLHSLSADWLHLNTFPHMEDALSRTGRFINTWKIGFAMKANQCSSHLHWVKQWIETFWSNYSDTQYWLTKREHFYTCGRCSTKDQKASQHLENPFCHESKSMFWPFIVNQTVIYRLFGPTAVVHSADWLNLNTFPLAEDALLRTKGLLSAWKNGFIIRSDGKSMFWPWYWITPWIHTFWAQGSGIQSWLAPPEYQSNHGAGQD